VNKRFFAALLLILMMACTTMKAVCYATEEFCNDSDGDQECDFNSDAE
jgi:hypothetical protein